MSIKIYASSTGEAIVYYPGQPNAERDGTVWQYSARGWCLRSAVFSLVPANGTAITDAAFTGLDTTGIDTSNLELTGVRISPNQSPGMVDVEFTFKYSTYSSGTWGGHFDGEIEQRAETTVREVPLQAVYDQEAGTGSDLEAAAKKAGEAEQETISVPGLKYYYTTYTSSFNWSETDLITVSAIAIANVGAPTGLEVTTNPPDPADTPTENKWLLQGKSIENVGGGLVKVSEEWEYSPVNWN